MANQIFPTARQAYLEGQIGWLSNEYQVVLLDATYTYSEAHEFHDSLTGIVAQSGNLGGKTATNGIADASDVTFPTVSGADITQVVVVQWTGVSATSRNIVYFDSDTSQVMLNVTPDGTDIILRWSDGPLKIFRL